MERLLAPQELQVDEAKLGDVSAYPVTVRLKHLPPPKDWANGDVRSGLYRSNLFAAEETQTNGTSDEDDEIIHCKFVVGCDGARSWVRT